MTERLPARVRQAKRTLAERLAAEPGFVGAGISTGRSGGYEIVVLVSDAACPALAKVPDQWEGIPVRAEVSGTPRKF